MAAADRRSLARVGVASAGTACVIGAVSAVGGATPLVVIAVLQALVAVAWCALVDAPARAASIALIAVVAGAADVVVSLDEGSQPGRVVAVVGFAVVAAFLLELARRPPRERVTDSLTATIAGVVLVVGAAHVVALAARPDGERAAAVALVAAGAALGVGRAVDAVLPGAPLAPGAHRGIAGAAAAVVVGALVGAALGEQAMPLTTTSGALLGAASASAAAIADLGLELAAADAVGVRARGAARLLTALVPVCLVAPVAYAADRLLVG